jgi:hypothetical protein
MASTGLPVPPEDNNASEVVAIVFGNSRLAWPGIFFKKNNGQSHY